MVPDSRDCPKAVSPKRMNLPFLGGKSFRGLSQTALRRILKIPRNKEFFTKLNGHPFRVLDSTSFYWSYREIVDSGIYRFPNATNSPRILDCGANIGLASLFFLTQYPNCYLTAVEPDPDIFAVLKENLGPYWTPRISCRCVALAGKSGHFQFFQNRGDSGRLMHPSNVHHATTSIEAIPLDDLLLEPVDFLKLDIEGSEVQVLATSKNLHRAGFVFVEYHSFQGWPQELEIVLEKLKSQGFRYWIQNHFTPSRYWDFTESIGGMDCLVNIFARNENI